MSIWMAASLRKKMELASKAFSRTVVLEIDPASDSGVCYPTTPLPPSPTALLEPALTIIGHEHRIYYACPSSAAGNGDITILGPDEKFANLSTRSVQGIFRLIRLYGSILDYGYQMDEGNGDEGEVGLWSEYLGRIFEAVSRTSMLSSS